MLIFNNDWPLTKKTWYRDLLLWILAAAVYYLTLKIFFYAQIKLSGHEITFTCKQIVLNLTSFLPQALGQIFNLWDVYFSKTLGILIGILAIAAIGINFFVVKKNGWGRLIGLIILFLVFSSIWFLFGGYMPRQFIAAQALALTLVYWLGECLSNLVAMKKEAFIRIWAVFFASVSLMIANQMTSSNVLNNYSELMFMRSRLAQMVDTSTQEIHIIRLKDMSKGYNGLPTVYDNINSSTADYEIPDLVRVALKDMGDPFELHCIVTFSNYGESFKLLPKAVVIDMNDLVYISSPQQR
jgi:hypothetical protein